MEKTAVSGIISSDTIIVGGGIAGLYACYKLMQLKGAGHSISLFEATDRFGGRIETVEMRGFLAEYGPMRFEKRAQPLLMDLISELGLETKYFVPYTAARDPESLFDLTFDESGGKRSGRKLNALELMALGILRLLNASAGDMDNPSDHRHWDWWATLDEEYYSYVRNVAEYKGTPLYKVGLWNALGLVLSERAVRQIINYGTFYHFIHLNPNAAEWIIFWLRGLHPLEGLVGIKQGSEALTREIALRLNSASPSVSLHLNHKLTALYPQPDGRVLLEFEPEHHSTGGIGSADMNSSGVSNAGVSNAGVSNAGVSNAGASNAGASNAGVGNADTVKALANHVVLALPRSALMQLRPMLPKHIGELSDSVIPIPLLKCFFVNEDPWWDGSTPPQTRASSTPAREIHYYVLYEECEGKVQGGKAQGSKVQTDTDQGGKGSGCKHESRKRGLVMVYGDSPSRHCWMPFVQGKEHLKAELNCDCRLIEGYLRYLRSNPDSADVDEIRAEAKLISCFGIRDWSREPYEAGCHAWKAGVRVEEAIRELSAFSLPGAHLPDRNVHICGEAYSDFQGFIEGGLRTALKVIKQI